MLRLHYLVLICPKIVVYKKFTTLFIYFYKIVYVIYSYRINNVYFYEALDYFYAPDSYLTLV